MWMLRVLKGPNQGFLYPLSQGINSIGRASSCSIQIDAPGISRNHVELHVGGAEIRLLDKESSNGTYINGVKVHEQTLETGDQVSIHKVVFDIVRNHFSQNVPVYQQQGFSSSAQNQIQQSAALQNPSGDLNPQMQNNPFHVVTPLTPHQQKNRMEKIQHYLEKIE